MGLFDVSLELFADLKLLKTGVDWADQLFSVGELFHYFSCNRLQLGDFLLLVNSLHFFLGILKISKFLLRNQFDRHSLILLRVSSDCDLVPLHVLNDLLFDLLELSQFSLHEKNIKFEIVELFIKLVKKLII